MWNWLQSYRRGPIGLDWGGRWLKLVQFSGDRKTLLDTARVELPASSAPLTPELFSQLLAKARAGRDFRGNEVVVCLSESQLQLQTVRIPKASAKEMERAIRQEVATRLPFKLEEADIRYLEAGDVRQANSTLREVIVAACHRPTVEEYVRFLATAGLRTVAIDMEPLALLRGGAAQFRREGEQDCRTLFAHVGYQRTLVVVAQGDEPILIKYIELGGRDFDAAVASHLELEPPFAAALRRTMGDRRGEQQDPEVAGGVREATRPVLERLCHELALCVRYHGVTFRGHSLRRLVLGGGEASPALQDALHTRLELDCELSEPFRAYPVGPNSSRRGQWEIAVGLALRELSA